MTCEQTTSATSINVMFLCDEWKSSKGGLSTFNREFAVNLAKTTSDSIKVHCYVAQSDELSREDARQHGVNLITAQSIPGSSDPLDWLKIPPPELPNPHIVVGHGRKFGTPAYFIVRAAKCKWMQFVHVFCEDLGKFKATQSAAVDTIEDNEKKHKREIELCKAADVVVAVGSRLQHKYGKCLPHVKVEIITPGILEKFSNESLELVKDKSMVMVKKFNVFMFGRARFEDLTLKGYDIVANAIGSLSKMFELTFVGSSSGEHRKIEQWFLDNTCISRNQITIRSYCNEQEELKMMFHGSDAITLPSRTEGFGLVALEAISAGIPVLVAGESGIAEALHKVEGGKCVTVESDDAEEWARRIQQLSSQSPEERENNAKLLRENYNKTFPWSSECERFKRMIQDLMESSNDQCENVAVPVEKPISHFADEEMLAPRDDEDDSLTEVDETDDKDDSVSDDGGSSYVAVVAIDFGTTYSGFAFSFIEDHGKYSIFMNRDWMNEQGGRTSQTPTCLLLNSNLSFDSFGHEAVEKYAGLQNKCNEGEYLFFQHFKMALHNDKTINTETTIKASNGHLVKAKTVFAHSIRFLKEEAIKVICQETGDDHFSANDIQWVLTVPAIWTPRAKQFMREAAYEAGLGSPENPEQVMIALEPEAAAISCLEKNVSEFQSETGCSSVEGLLSQPNTHYMVVDIGGGTLDVTVHAIQDDGNIKEIHKVTGGPYGGIKVNQQFEALLDELLDARKLQTYRKQSPSDWLCLMNEFEGKKRGERILDSKVMTNIRLPRSFVSLANQCWRSRYGEKDVKLKNNEYLALSSGVMKQLFVPVIEDIKKHLKSLQRNPQLSKVKTMLLVGGFADSALLQKEIKSEFSRKFRVLIPNNAAIAVVQGAVMFGKKPSKISERVVRTTYGAACARDFIQGVHREEKKFVADGIEKCRNLFNLFVRENEKVRAGQKITSIYTLLRATDISIEFSFYASSNPDAEYVTDPGMKKIGSVMVQSPDTWRGKDREIEVSMYFGRTEITATAKDVSSGNVAQTSLDFFHS